MKAISFLGLGTKNKETNQYAYQESSYLFSNEKIVKTPYFPFAVNQVYRPDEHIVFMTEEAKFHHNDKLSALFKYHEVEIPKGENEEQFWEIFDDFIELIDENDETILDFTYGFRSQPVLAISALLFLKSFKKTKIRKVIYGAFEAITDGKVPVFDLTSFVELIDWSYAVHDYLKYGKAGYLNEILAKLQKAAFLNPESINPEGLNSFGKALNQLTKSISLVNTMEIFEDASNISKNSDRLINDLQNIRSTKPIALLLRKMVDRIEPIIASENNLFDEKGLNAQLKIIDWMVDTEQYQQAITLMNEFYLTLECLELNLNPIERENRQKVSLELGKEIDKLKEKKLDGDRKIKIVLWNKLTELRNHVNHAGIKIQTPNTNRQIESIKNLSKDLIDFYDEFRKPRVMINLSNHPATKWASEHVAAAKQTYGEIIDLPFPEISPMHSESEIAEKAESLVRQLLTDFKGKRITVHIMGEFSFTYHVISYLKALGIKCICSTTERIVEESGDKKTTTFKFVKFREYKNY